MFYCSALYISFAIFLVGLYFFILALRYHRHERKALIGAVFFITIIIFLPISRDMYPNTDCVAQFFIAMYHAVKIFLVDGDSAVIYGILQNALNSNMASETVIIIYEYVILALFFVAPITTATVIISFFSNITAYLHLYTIGKFRHLYVFSELNDKSLALAKDIRKKNKKAILVFNDVYRKNEETQTELVADAKNIGGLCFQKDIMHLKLNKFRHKIEFFIIGLNESENINQAIELTRKFKNRENTRIYVWARSAESGCILDSIELYDEKKAVETEKSAAEPEKNKDGNTDKAKDTPVIPPEEFRLRRIDDIELFAWNTLREANLFAPEKCIRYGGEKLISILIIGMGDYGKEFLKCAVWMYQMIGYRLEINVIDRENIALKQMWHQCPELMSMNDCTEEGEGHYSIRFIENVDIFTNDFDNLFFNASDNDPEIAARLKRTTAVFVTLGDDDTNIRAALEIRKLFDRVHYEKYLKKAAYENVSKVEEAARLKTKPGLTKSDKKKIKKLAGAVNEALQDTYTTTFAPEIYAPVYDTVKAGNIRLQKEDKEEKTATTQLRSYENIPFNIYFKGSFNEQYAYDKITRNQLENDAGAYHLQWDEIEDWGESLKKYNQYEYYRRSSMAQAIHKEMMMSNFPEIFGCEENRKAPESKIDELQSEQNCECMGCLQSQLVEHMRWNVYMRTEGFSLAVAEQRFRIKQSRARLHCDLVLFGKLSTLEKKKDSTIRKKH